MFQLHIAFYYVTVVSTMICRSTYRICFKKVDDFITIEKQVGF